MDHPGAVFAMMGVYGYVNGGDMVGPDSALFCAGSLRLERPARAAGERPVVRHGPERVR
ncbi:hypothetical protein [Streptomyces sp. NPDC018833]|uniref:hypothetical protein n=1 Tax=Streptomyces sp. NPDC018833 TaxID=3365053 RepID=UPI0037A102CE